MPSSALGPSACGIVAGRSGFDRAIRHAFAARACRFVGQGIGRTDRRSRPHPASALPARSPTGHRRAGGPTARRAKPARRAAGSHFAGRRREPSVASPPGCTCWTMPPPAEPACELEPAARTIYRRCSAAGCGRRPIWRRLCGHAVAIEDSAAIRAGIRRSDSRLSSACRSSSARIPLGTLWFFADMRASFPIAKCTSSKCWPAAWPPSWNAKACSPSTGRGGPGHAPLDAAQQMQQNQLPRSRRWWKTGRWPAGRGRPQRWAAASTIG